MLSQVTSFLLLAVEQAPDDEDVKAGWVAFGIFLALGVAVVLLGISLTRRLKNAERSEELGLYDPSTKKPRQSVPQAPDPSEAADPDQEPTASRDDER